MCKKKCDNLSISPWIGRFAPLIPNGGRVLDLAAGGGRHSRFLLDRGLEVTALDRKIDGLEALRDADPVVAKDLVIIEADLEDGPDWPLGEQRFDAVIVVNYLWRPLLPAIVQAGDLLLYETFAAGNEAYGRPANPDFLLRPGELLEAVAGHLEVLAYEHGRIEDQGGTRIKQRLVAAKTTPLMLPPP